MNNQQHRNQWNYNEEIINWCKSNNFTYYDWIITITFYTALHKIDYCLHISAGLTDTQIIVYYKFRRKYTGHGARNKQVIQHLRNIASDYIDLYTESRRVRYKQTNLNQISDTDLNHYLNIWYNIIKPFNP